MTLKEGDGAGWSVHGHVGAPRFLIYWREDPLRAHLTEAGWVVDEVRRGESTPIDRPSESWLAVFATRGSDAAQEFWARIEAALGAGYARHWASQTVIAELGGRTRPRPSTRA